MKYKVNYVERIFRRGYIFVQAKNIKEALRKVDKMTELNDDLIQWETDTHDGHVERTSIEVVDSDANKE